MCQKLIDYPKKLTTDVLNNCFKKVFQKKKKSRRNCWFVCNKIANKITKASRKSLQNSLETVTNEAENIGLGKEIPGERFIFPEKRQKITDDLRLM